MLSQDKKILVLNQTCFRIASFHKSQSFCALKAAPLSNPRQALALLIPPPTTVEMRDIAGPIKGTSIIPLTYCIEPLNFALIASETLSRDPSVPNATVRQITFFINDDQTDKQSHKIMFSHVFPAYSTTWSFTLFTTSFIKTFMFVATLGDKISNQISD